MLQPCYEQGCSESKNSCVFVGAMRDTVYPKACSSGRAAAQHNALIGFTAPVLMRVCFDYVLICAFIGTVRGTVYPKACSRGLAAAQQGALGTSAAAMTYVLSETPEKTLLKSGEIHCYAVAFCKGQNRHCKVTLPVL